MRLNKSKMAILLSILILLTGVLTTTANGGVPWMIQYQGRLTTDVGEPLDGFFTLTFALYDDSVATTRIWKEVHDSVTVEDGLFTVILGSVAALNPTTFTGTPLWLGIAVGGGDLMTPLTPITSIAYAYRSEHADHATTADHADTADVAITSATGGWKDIGSVVTLTTPGDSVGIGTEHPIAPLHVEAGDITAIYGHSIGGSGAAGVIGSNDNDGVGVYGSSATGEGVRGSSGSGFGGYFTGLKNYFFGRVGIETENPLDMLHIYTEDTEKDAYIRLESVNGSTWGEAGLKFKTPENTWWLRAADYNQTDIPAGGLGLHNVWNAQDIMTWTQSGNVGINNTNPMYRLEVKDAETAIRGMSTGDGIGIHGSSISGYGGYFSGPKNYLGGNTGFGNTNPTHTVTINGSIAFQSSGITKYHMRHYNGGLNLAEAGIADYRLFVKDGGNIGIGTSNPTEKLHVNGNAHVAGTFHADDFETNAIDHTNIIDEVGIASRADDLGIPLTSTWASYLSRQLTVPTSGYILAIGYAEIELFHGVSGTSKGLVTFSDSTVTGFSVEISSQVVLLSNVNAGDRMITIPVQRLFYVDAAGTYTYHMIATKGTGDNTSLIDNRQMDLLFIPTAYSSKNGQITGIDDNIFLANESEMNDINFVTEAPSSADKTITLDALESKLTRLLNEVQEVKKEMDLLKKQ